MSDDKLIKAQDKDLSSWFSTYGLITVERIFDNFGFQIKHDEINNVLHDKNSIYYQFLIVPFSNILNDIILHQVDDYREFLQKLFIDYLLSGAGNETDAPVQGEDSRKSLEEERQNIINIGDQFDLDVFQHNSLIADSQKELIAIAKSSFSNMSQVTNESRNKLMDIVNKYEVRADELNLKFCDYRREFQKSIILVQELVEILPDFSLDPDKMVEHRESIYFDPEFGEDKQ